MIHRSLMQIGCIISSDLVHHERNLLGASIAMQQVEPSFATLAYHAEVLNPVLPALIQIQLPLNTPRKAADHDTSAWSPATHV